MEDQKFGGVIKTLKKERDFVMLQNSLFTDKRISFKAKGILAYLLSKPNNWETRVSDVVNQSTEGMLAVRSGITELILAGYMELNSVIVDGKFVGRFYLVREEPFFTTGFRRYENRNKAYRPEEELLDPNLSH